MNEEMEIYDNIIELKGIIRRSDPPLSEAEQAFGIIDSFAQKIGLLKQKIQKLEKESKE